MYTAFLFFVLLFFAVFLLVSSTIRLLLKSNADKTINKIEKIINNIVKKAKKKNISIPLASIIIVLAAIFIAGIILTYL